MRGKWLALLAASFAVASPAVSWGLAQPAGSASTGLLELVRTLSARGDAVGVLLLPAPAAARVVPDLLRVPKGVRLFVDECVPGLQGRGRRLGGSLAGVLVLFRAAGTTTIGTGAVGGELRVASLPDASGQNYAALAAQLRLRDLLQQEDSFPVCP